MNRLSRSIIAVLLALMGCDASDSRTGAGAADDAAMLSEWRTYGRDANEQRFSPLTAINRDTVGRLGVAWTYDLRTNRGVEATPLVVDGAMYVTSAWSVVHALDAATGQERWVYDPEVPGEVGVNACCDVVNRGVAYANGRIYVGALDGRLIALDAKTGDVVWSVVTVDQSKPYTITGAPRAAKGKVLIGNGGAEYGVRGYISAYDEKTGDLIWRFYTTPNPSKQPDGAASDESFAALANETWGDEGDWPASGGGGTVWDSIVFDEVNDAVIFGVGNGSPWNQKFRDPSGGDNLFLSSIVSVDIETGKYRWHFQTTPGDRWDYTATQTIILAELPLGENGAMRRVAMQAPKNGFFYVLDAATGEFLSGDSYVPQTWAEGLSEDGRPIVKAAARYEEAASTQTPGPLGGHNWHPMAFSPQTGLVYIPAQEMPGAYATDPFYGANSALWNTGVGSPPSPPARSQPMSDAQRNMMRAFIKGRLLAWDPVAREARWKVEYDNPWNGGVLATAAGLVFQGQLSGTFGAFDAATGDKLWETQLKAGAAAAPMTYEIDGEQYVSIATGWGTAFTLVTGLIFNDAVPPMFGRVVTFKLGGEGKIPDPDLPPIDATPKAPSFGDEAQLTTGSYYYGRMCGACHGPLARSSGVLPDIRWSPFAADKDAWLDIVSEGALKESGMIGFGEYLTDDEVEAIRAYVLFEANPETP